MNKAQKTKFNLLYQRHVSALQRQGKAERTIDGYSRAIRRITEYFDRNGLQFFFKYVLDKELQHTLPKGFRRARDYGFLHGNAKQLMQRVQWLLKVHVPPTLKTQRPPFLCQHCKAPMAIIGFKTPRPKPG